MKLMFAITAVTAAAAVKYVFGDYNVLEVRTHHANSYKPINFT